MSDALRQTARGIFAAALQAVDVGAAVRSAIDKRDGMLVLGGRSMPLVEVDRVLIVALGKAAVPMYRAAAERLRGPAHAAVVVAPASTLPVPVEDDSDTLFVPGAHPTPDADSLRAADAVLHLLARATKDTAVLFLISGGASAMVERPLSDAITIDDLAAFSRALVCSGMGITGMNTLRKHLSAVKGGRLAVAASAARMQCTLLVSDVPAASPDAIASGPSLPDSTTVYDTRRLFHQMQQTGPMPAPVEAWFQQPALPETPKPGDAAFARAHWQVILSSDHLAYAAAQAAEAAGFHTVIDNTPDDWDYQAAAKYLMGRSAMLGEQHARTCLISVGEVGVTVPPHAGEGGRNQHFALWCAAEIARLGMRSTVLSAGSDGVDGQSSAAGAVCDETTVARAHALRLSTNQALDSFDSAPLLRQTGDAIHTGATGQNLRDLRFMLTAGNSPAFLNGKERGGSPCYVG